MKPDKIKEPIRLRRRKLSDGSTSLYLDIYYKGRRQYEFLKLYLIPERTTADRQRNTQTLTLANTLKAKRIVDLQASAHGFTAPTTGGRLPLLEYLQTQQQEYIDRGSRSYARQIGCLIRHLQNFGASHNRMEDVDRRFIEDFIFYLRRLGRSNDHPLRESSQRTYLDIFSVLLARAVRAGLIPKNPVQEVSTTDRPQCRCRPRSFLTLQEVQQLAATPCRREDVKRAFLFSCFCGLRYSDIKALKWGNIRMTSDGRQQIEVVQTKTQEEVYLPLSENALAVLPERGASTAPVFSLPWLDTTNDALRQWVADAGIEKHVSFHVARHTCATLLLTFGADLYTVSKLLGHSNVQTTQIYAKVVDEKKRAAVDLVPAI